MITALGAALFLILSGPALSQEPNIYDIRGRVVDAEGSPVANIQLATSWGFQGDSVIPRWRSDAVAKLGTSLRTDEHGRFSGKLYARRPDVAIYALDMEKKLGGIFIYSLEDPGKEYMLEIEPLVRLHGTIDIGNSNVTDSTYYIYVTDKRAIIAIASSVSNDTDFSIFMPPGEYEVSFSAKDLEKVTTEVALSKGDVDLGAVALSPTNLALHYGREPPPWIITEARGVKKDVSLSDYKGKWVLIEFWAYW